MHHTVLESVSGLRRSHAGDSDVRTPDASAYGRRSSEFFLDPETGNGSYSFRYLAIILCFDTCYVEMFKSYD